MSQRWDEEADVVVVGFGGAGACAAIEAREAGAEVIALDRFGGGGATAISGGVVYAGGGTHVQAEAGVEDDVGAMFDYLKLEVKGVVSDETLRDFCQQSAANLRWLAERGVPFDASLCPVKTSYPSDDYFLYYSGNEGFLPWRQAAKPAPRGHRAKGRSLPGRNLYEPLRRHALAVGVQPRYHSRATALVREGDRVVGVEVARIPPGLTAWLHGLLEARAIKVVNYTPGLARRLRAWGRRLEARAQPWRVRARGGVVLAAGGFIYNRAMVQEHAPGYRPGMPLGTAGCMGQGIALGQSVGGAVDLMDRVSAWRFLNPPEAFTRGALINRAGRRYVNEALYGAAVGEELVDRNGGVGLLILDSALIAEARTQVGRGKTQWFQTAPTLLNLKYNCRRADDLAALAKLCRCPPEALEATLAEYNRATEAGEPDAFQKDKRHALKPPYFVMDCSITSRRWPLPTLTLGGLVVDEATGRVRAGDGGLIEGLYAAGRNAVGICSQQYISGLSIADCVYSGRRAGRSAAASPE